MSRYIGIAQNWKMDEERLGAGIDLSSSSSDPFQVLLFPEGGSLNSDNREVGSQNSLEISFAQSPRLRQLSCFTFFHLPREVLGKCVH